MALRGLNIFELPRPAALAGGAALFLMAVIVDYATTYELTMTTFYMFVVLMVTWNCRWKWGLAFAVSSFAVPVVIGSLTGHPYSSPVYFYIASVNRLVSYLVALGLTEQLRRRLEHEKESARLDHLTGIANQRGFYEALEVEVVRHRRDRTPLAVVYIDCDNFKQVNDTAGHREGDRLLRNVAQTVRVNVRRTDVTARMGGDEFALVLSTADRDRALAVIDKLKRELDAMVARGGWPVSFSMGVAVFMTIPESADAIVSAADRLMYRVKTSGKNDVQTEVIDGP